MIKKSLLFCICATLATLISLNHAVAAPSSKSPEPCLSPDVTLLGLCVMNQTEHFVKTRYASTSVGLLACHYTANHRLGGESHLTLKAGKSACQSAADYCSQEQGNWHPADPDCS